MNVIIAQPNLATLSQRIKNAMKNADTGPLVIAKDVLELAANWHAYKKEAGGLKITAWLTKELGSKQRNLAFFQRRQHAVDILGEEIRRTMHHEVAVYVNQNVPETQLQEVKKALNDAYIRNNHNPLTPNQAKPIIHDIIGKPEGHHECLRCQELEAQVVELMAKLNGGGQANANVTE